MGKEWYRLSGKIRPSSSSSSSSYSSNSKRGSRGGKCAENENSLSNSSSSPPATAARGGGGCMGAVFQLFDFHHQFHSPNSDHHPDSFKFPNSSNYSFLDDEEPPADAPEGTEAPRNSLELDHGPHESPLPVASSKIIRKDEHLLRPSTMRIQIKTSRDRQPSIASSPEIGSSPGTKTPTLVVRLMGLDLLPDSTSSSSPRPSLTLDIGPRSQDPHHQWIAGRKSCSDIDSSDRKRSLPETPRMSLARRSDVDHCHRPSLQTTKENTSRTVGEDFDFSLLLKNQLKCSSEDGNTRSPRHYARQIVNQVKERMSRRVGMIDVTNVIRSRSEQGNTNDQISKRKKPPSISRVTEVSSPMCSPGLRYQVTNNIQNIRTPEVQAGLTGYSGDATRTMPQCCSRAGDKLSCMKLGSVGDGRVRRPKTRLAATEFPRSKPGELFVGVSLSSRTNQKNDTIVSKKCKTSACGIGKREGAPTAAALPVEKDPSLPATKIPHKQVHDIETSRPSSQLAFNKSTRSCRCDHEAMDDVLVVRKKKNGNSGSMATAAINVTDDKQAESQYVCETMRCAGAGSDTRLSSFTRPFSPSHPLQPSIFRDLENSFSTRSDGNSSNVSRQVLDHRCNRKQLFPLVGELLADLLKPYLNDKPRVNTIQSCSLRTGWQLIDRLRTNIECQVLEDIDTIIDRDLPESEMRRPRASEEEGDCLVSELERDIWEELVLEVVREEFPAAVSGRTGN